MSVEITYERVPPMCKQCKAFGHIDAQCPPKGVWTSKVKTIEAWRNTPTLVCQWGRTRHMRTQ